MSYLKLLYGGFVREAKIGKLKTAFNRECPGEDMNVLLESYCGIGMAVAHSLNGGTQDRLTLLNQVDAAMMLEKEHHRPFAQQAYDIGVSTMLNK